jgi:hypothetical protein
MIQSREHSAGRVTIDSGVDDASIHALAAEKGFKLGRVRLTAGHALAESIARPKCDDGRSLRGGGGEQHANDPDQPDQLSLPHFHLLPRHRQHNNIGPATRGPKAKYRRRFLAGIQKYIAGVWTSAANRITATIARQRPRCRQAAH